MARRGGKLNLLDVGISCYGPIASRVGLRLPMLRGGSMIVIETFERGRASRSSSLGEIRIDTS